MTQSETLSGNRERSESLQVLLEEYILSQGTSYRECLNIK
jgi:hypothetical protein